MITTRQIKAARALLGWSQADLARKSGVSEPTIARLEAADGDLGGRENTGQKIKDAIEAAGVQFFEEKRGRRGRTASEAKEAQIGSTLPSSNSSMRTAAGRASSENPSGLNDPNKVQGTRLPQKARGSALSPIASPQQRLTAEQNRGRSFAAGLTIATSRHRFRNCSAARAKLIAASAALRRSGRYRASMIPLRCRNRCRSKTKFKRAAGPQATLHDQMKQTGP